MGCALWFGGSAGGRLTKVVIYTLYSIICRPVPKQRYLQCGIYRDPCREAGYLHRAVIYTLRLYRPIKMGTWLPSWTRACPACLYYRRPVCRYPYGCNYL